jgi:hypothetical protein
MENAALPSINLSFFFKVFAKQVLFDICRSSSQTAVSKKPILINFPYFGAAIHDM